MFIDMLKIGLTGLLLFTNPFMHCMKRASEVSDAHKNSQIVKIAKPNDPMQELDILYSAAMPNLKVVDILYTPSNRELALLPAHEKLFALSDLNEKRKIVVDNVQAKRQALLLSLPSQEALSRLEREEKLTPTLLRRNKFNAQEELRKTYNIPNGSKQWLGYMLKTCAKIEFNLKSMQQPWDNTTWDINTPPKFAKSLIYHMEKNGLDISAFNVRVVPDELIDSAGACFEPAEPALESVSGATNLQEYNENPSKAVWHYKKDKPALMSYNPIIAKYTDEHIDFVVGHELPHALNSDIDWDHGTVNAVVGCAKVAIEEVLLNRDRVKLKLAQEIIADTRVALQDPTKVDAAISSGCLYFGSYDVLAMIKTNAEVRTEIAARNNT